MFNVFLKNINVCVDTGYFVWPKQCSPFLIIFDVFFQKTLTKRGSSKKMNHTIHHFSVIMKYQQDELILRALMYCINSLMHNAPCCKIFKVCLTILGHYVATLCIEGLKIRKQLLRNKDFQYLCTADNVENLPWKINHEHCIFNAIFNMNLAAGIFGKIPFESVRSSRSQMFFKMCHLKNFANFARKYLCCDLFIIKRQTQPRPAT